MADEKRARHQGKKRHHEGTRHKKERRNTQGREILKRLKKNRVAMLGLAIILIFVLIAVFAPLIAPYGYREADLLSANATPSLKHLFGCDDMGRDIFSRLIYGSRWSLGLGVSATVFGLIFGIILGSIAGYFGGIVEDLIMRCCDIFQSIPGVLLQIIISAALGDGFFFTVIALGIGRVANVSRLIRAQILSVREQEYIEAATALNVPRWVVVIKHILPNSIQPLIVSSTMGIGGTIMAASGLSYLGLGIQPPSPEWGAMLSAAKEYCRYYPHMVLFPGICIAVFVLAVNFLGDGLRDAMDPKLKN